MKCTYDDKAKTVTVVIPYDQSKEYPVSKTGKSRMAANSGGFALIPGTTAKLSFNLITPVE